MKITIGALAHVDAGKTTLSETILYKTQSIRNKGRVDNKDTFLDYNQLEKEKGITIYNKQALFAYKDKEYIFLDTPGHTDLAYETNRAINVLDCAIIIVSTIDNIPVDTVKLFNNLLNYNIPILIFVNKMDISNYTKDYILKQLKDKLSPNCVNYEDSFEHISLLSDSLLEQYINTNTIDSNTVNNCLGNNYLIPCFFGSALKDEGVDELLEYIYQYINVFYDDKAPLNAYLYKINNEYSYLKVLSGILNNKTIIGDNKINEMYEVNGNNYSPVSNCLCGNIVAVKGLKDIPIGTYLPSFECDTLYKVPSLTYRLLSNVDSNDLIRRMKDIIIEYPELNIRQKNNNIFIDLNGELHQTIIKNVFKERLNIDVEFSDPIIKYKETIGEEIIGIGHFEPLKHYAEVIVKLEPSNSGIEVSSLINNSYTNTLISYLRNYPIRGILTNSLLTNIKITIVDMKTHPKHTEGGDLLQATKRAIRQGLSKIKSILLEPYYLCHIETDAESLNSIISVLSNNQCEYSLQDDELLTKVSQINFNNVITSLKSKMRGNLSFEIEELIYEECKNQEEIIKQKGYDYKSDIKNPAGSIFCKSGAGHYVEPNEVETLMHLNINDYIPKSDIKTTTHNKSNISDEELKRVWNSLYKPKERIINKIYKLNEERIYEPKPSKPLMYLIDGYNLMYYLDEEYALSDITSARMKTIDVVCDFAGYVNADTVLVFDAYIANGSKPEIEKHDNITIVYTKEKQTADTYIEVKTKELKDDYKIIVVTSDNLEQLRVFANNASIISSREFAQRYDNFRKYNKHLNNSMSFKPFEDLKKMLDD